ncbi:hypothetical protein [Vibrio diabolicus]|uniref:hypothetical protein n=1 Tax=Vibrio diabolicus TaxID=50719 RepID=UPI00215FDE6C|nr:hypothetical protein [Vibrio diabolicus]MCS0306578.1 hypothetical protein [Vibrio diabolicus]
MPEQELADYCNAKEYSPMMEKPGLIYKSSPKPRRRLHHRTKDMQLRQGRKKVNFLINS